MNSQSATFRQTEKKILDSIIGEGHYDSRIRPSGNPINKTGDSAGEMGKIWFLKSFVDKKKTDSCHVFLSDGPCIVRVNIFVRSISRIDDVSMVCPDHAITDVFVTERNVIIMIHTNRNMPSKSHSENNGETIDLRMTILEDKFDT